MDTAGFGCIKQPKLRVVRHLRSLFPADTPGNRNNKGCRLTDAEILGYLNELSDFVRQRIGPGVSLAWNWPPAEYRDTLLINRGAGNGMTFLTFRSRVQADPQGS